MYMQVNVIFGVPLTEDWCEKYDINSEDLEDMLLYGSSYSGSGNTPMWYGIDIGGWDECVAYMQTAEFNDVPCTEDYEKVMTNYNGFKTYIISISSQEAFDNLPPIAVYHMFGSS